MITKARQPSLPHWVITLLWSWAIPMSGLSAQPPLNLAFHHLDRNNGLSQGTCSYISRDSRGFVWIGTIDGLNRFDGQNVKIYRPDPSDRHSLVGNYLTSACYEDAATGDLWLTTYNAVHRYVRAQDHFDTIQLKNPQGERLVEDYYAFHLDSAGKLWLRVGDGRSGLGFLHVFDTRTGRDSILCALTGARSTLISDKTGRAAYVLCSEYRKPGMELVDLHRGCLVRRFLTEGPTASPVHETCVESDTLVWLALADGIAAFNPKTGAISRYSEFAGKPVGQTWSVRPYGDQLLFVGTLKNGLWVFDRLRRRFIQRLAHEAGNPYSLLDDEVENLFIDREANLWVAHWKYGLSFVNLQKSKFDLPVSGKDFSFWQLLQGPDGNIWCSEPDSGLFVYTPDGRFVDTLNRFFPQIGHRLSFTSRFYFPKGTNLGLYARYLLKWDNTGRRLEFVEQLPYNMFGFCETPRRELLAIADTAVLRLMPNPAGTYSVVPVAVQAPFQPKNLSAIFTDSRNRVYLAENAQRLLVFDLMPQGLRFIRSIEGNGDCRSFLEMPDGVIWVAGSSGLLRIKPDLSYRVLNETSDGLPNATYYGVAADRRGRLWLSSNQGMVCYDPDRRTMRRYMPVDGLFGAEFNRGSFFHAPDGRIWAGGMGGLARFHPDSIRILSIQPQVQFTQIMANDASLKVEKQIEVLDFLDLPYAQNTVSLSFVALEFSDPGANQFQFRLLGYDDEWVKSGTRGFARYANLPPGRYTFEVVAANSDGKWSELPKRLVIRIQTPFYKTWWFYLLCAMAAAALIYAWFRYRLEQALKIERMRVQISSDLHDDVGTLLSGLAMQSEVLELTAAEKDKGKLRRIGEISRDAMSRMRDTVWAIDARKDKLENLLDRMREHAEETLTPRGILFSIEAEHLNLKQNLPSIIRQSLYLIYKEAVTNAAKHSDGDKLLVSLNKSSSGFEMRIVDNGHAPEKTYKTTGSGTANMHMRAEKIGGTLEINREGGYCVVLRLPALS